MENRFRRYQFYTTKKKNKKLIVIIILLTIVLLGSAVFIFKINEKIGNFLKGISSPGMQSTSMSLEELWDAGLYNEVIELSKKNLEADVLSSRYLIYYGYASYHKAFFEEIFEYKVPLLDEAVTALRKARLVASKKTIPQIDYILGKSYYHKGEYFYDLALIYLKSALDNDYSAVDIYEYIALCYGGLNENPEKELEFFLKALENNVNDKILLSIAKVYIKLDQIDMAEVYIKRVLESSDNSDSIKEAYLSLCTIFEKRNNLEKAEEYYLKVIEIDPFSYIAHKMLGEIYYQKEDLVRGRYYARKAGSLYKE